MKEINHVTNVEETRTTTVKQERMISVRKEGMRPKKKQETVGSLRKKCAEMATCVDTNTRSYAQIGRKRETAT